MTPRTMALRYRIWAYASPLGWDCTIAEIADALDIPMGLARSVIIGAGWHNKIRSSTLRRDDVPNYDLIGALHTA